MLIATWNVNSIRTRLDQVTTWLESHPLDLLCLQETKVSDEEFPRKPFSQLGYHLYLSGQKSYNGVALVSREPLTEVSCGFAPVLGEQGGLDDQKRLITGLLRGVRVVNLYVPNGGSGSEKYEYKLHWLHTLGKYVKSILAEAVCLCGDFNVAPEDRDIHDPVAYAGHVMATVPERQALGALMALGLKDPFREFTPESGHYTWWDYRAGSFRRNRGWRIDHFYLSSHLVPKQCWIDPSVRELPRPSDHVPVLLEL